MKPKIKKSGSFFVRLISIILTMVCIVLLIGNCIVNIETELKNQIHQSLADVTQQNAVMLQKEVQIKKNFLKAVSSGFSQEMEQIENDLIRLQGMSNLYDFKRIGFIDLEGNVFTSDEHRMNLSDWELFRQTLEQGDAIISECVIDSVDLEKYGWNNKINVVTMPVYENNGKTIRGVAFASYRTEKFRDVLSMASFQGKGISCIVLQNGDIIAGDPERGLDENENLFEVMKSYGNENIPDVEMLQKNFAAEESGIISYQGRKTINYMYYMPVEVLSGQPVWYLTTIVGADILDSRTEVISHNVWQLTALLIATLLLCTAICFLTYWVQHKKNLKMAYIDPLTKGENYTYFRTKMRERKMEGYIVSVDLADFKIINNICGIQKGDELIRAMWEILKDMLKTKSSELGAHISGDSFVLFLTGTDINEIIQRVLKCNERLRELSSELHTPRIVPKFGIYQTEDSRYPEDGYGKANLAIKHIKSYWESCYAVYDEEFREHLLSENWMKDQFETALAQDQFQVWYQPKYSPKTNEPISAEALVRWKTPDGRLLQPGQFIPFFERNGMITQLDEYVFRQVCKDQKRWEESGYSILPVSVNLSRAGLYYHRIMEHFLSIVREMAIDIQYVQIEITESAMVENSNIEELLYEFKKAGFRILIDDFGTGYSSIATLNMKCFDTVKLDKKLIDSIGEPRGETLLRYLISMIHSLGLSVTAEGVECKEQVDVLSELSCDEIQGYYYSKPISALEYETTIIKKNSK